VINVQHRLPHQHSGDELELLATVGEQVGCVLELARLSVASAESAQRELALPAAPGTGKK
jgi:uroporphyrinogen-III synthase